MLHTVEDGAFGQDRKPCAAYFHRHGEEVVETEEVEVAGYVGDHGVDHNNAHFPESLDCGELLLVMLRFLVTDKAVVVAHGELEIVGIDEAAVHSG